MSDTEPDLGSDVAPPPVADEPTGDTVVAGRETRNPLSGQVLRFANKVHAALREWDRSDLAERITAESAQWSEQDLVVVACGDIKRGKSSLLNELLGRTDLLPVDADVATSVHLVIRHGSTPSVTVTRIGPEGEALQQQIAFAEVAGVASMQGDESLREGVVAVELRVPHPLLARGLVLIDTPGVGGMSRGHRDLALAALSRADALLFTISAQEPVARTELEFLAEASERTDRVVLVVTKSDVNSDEANAAMLAEHRAKLQAFTATMAERAAAGTVDVEVPARLSRLAAAPVVLTSSYLAAQGRRRHEAGREEQAERLFRRSGMPELIGVLIRSADNRDTIRLFNLIALLRVLLADAERQTRAVYRASSGESGVTEELAVRQRELEEFGSKQARWRTTLGNSIVRSQTNSSRLVTRELNRVRDHYREMIEQSTDIAAISETLPGDLERSLHGAWNELVEAINADFRATLGSVLDEFGAAGMDVMLGEMELPDGLRELAAGRSASVQGGDRFLEDSLPMAMQTYTFANMANGLAALLGVATGGLGFLAYGIGAAISFQIGGMRKRAREKQRMAVELQRFVSELLFGQEGVAKEFTTELSLRILDLREHVEQYVEQRLIERRKQIEQESRELQQLLRAEAGKRSEAQRSAKQRLDEIAKLRADLETVRQSVSDRLAASARRA